MSQTRPVRTLNPEVARKIAAGEVIDRPNAIIRELMDNSIDAGATSITVEITGGGIEKIRIVDEETAKGITVDDEHRASRPWWLLLLVLICIIVGSTAIISMKMSTDD